MFHGESPFLFTDLSIPVFGTYLILKIYYQPILTPQMRYGVRDTFWTRRRWHNASIIIIYRMRFSCLQEFNFVPGSYAYGVWQKPPVQIYLNVYVFNITNADRFLAGEDEKLDVQEIGPYVYM